VEGSINGRPEREKAAETYSILHCLAPLCRSSLSLSQLSLAPLSWLSLSLSLSLSLFLSLSLSLPFLRDLSKPAVGWAGGAGEGRRSDAVRSWER
jgi:hypothetical protein